MSVCPTQVTEAIRLYRDGQVQESCERLRHFLVQQPGHIDTLLWLAKTTPDMQEAVAAADLALKLDPENKVAQRAVLAVRERENAERSPVPRQDRLSTTISLSTGMTLAQARAVKWLFRQVNRPLGEALDDGTITLRDLAWAIESAWDARIQDAARTVLLTHLVGAEPEKPPPPLRVVGNSHFSEWQERKSIVISGMLAGAMVMVLLELFVTTLVASLLPWTWPWWATLGLLPLAGLFRLTLWSMDNLMDRADQYRMGRKGEENAIEELRYALDGRWMLFRNFEWPNRKWGDIDLILVGPGGVWVFEVKAYSGRLRNIGDRWERKGRWRWRRLTTHPGRQARRNAARLQEYLKNNGQSTKWVVPVVIWAGDAERDALTVEDPETPVWKLAEIVERTEELWLGRRLTSEAVVEVTAVLEQAVKIAREKENAR